MQCSPLNFIFDNSPINRRTFLTAIGSGIILYATPTEALAKASRFRINSHNEKYDDHIKDYLQKMHNFNKVSNNDVFIPAKKMPLLKSTTLRLLRIQATVGHGRFHVLNFDDAIKYARNYSKIGSFSQKELDFLEMIFYKDPNVYGFLGDKVEPNITSHISTKRFIKIPRTGNYLYKGTPFETYRKIRKELGNQVILTSGIRSITKQFLLFLNKTYKCKGNLSMASRSLAPPGYSFHGISDFDVGQVGFGYSNFTIKFIRTNVYKRLKELGYLKLRYPKNNMIGVRFEPWHIKI